MAKGDRDDKSSANPGGTKASDLPASVGGTKGSESGGRSANEAPAVMNAPESNPPTGTAPVTTDAAAHTPQNPPRSGLGIPGDDTRAYGSVNKAEAARRRAAGDPEFSQDDEDDEYGPSARGAVGGKGAKADPADLVEGVREFTRAVKSRQWSQAFQTGTSILERFGQLMETGAFNEHRTRPESISRRAGVFKEADSVGAELAAARNEVSQIHTQGPRFNWAGGGPDPTSGSPMPQGKPPANEAGSFADPQLIVILFELVSRVWDHFQSNRGGR